MFTSLVLAKYYKIDANEYKLQISTLLFDCYVFYFPLFLPLSYPFKFVYICTKPPHFLLFSRLVRPDYFNLSS